MSWFIDFLKEEDGPTAVEYAVMLALVITVCFAVIATIGTRTKEMMDPGGRLSAALS
jgi:pilus assembly protein Flp/PilA